MCNDQLQSEAGAIPDADSENAPTLEGATSPFDGLRPIGMAIEDSSRWAEQLTSLRHLYELGSPTCSRQASMISVHRNIQGDEHSIEATRAVGLSHVEVGTLYMWNPPIERLYYPVMAPTSVSTPSRDGSASPDGSSKSMTVAATDVGRIILDNVRTIQTKCQHVALLVWEATDAELKELLPTVPIVKLAHVDNCLRRATHTRDMTAALQEYHIFPVFDVDKEAAVAATDRLTLLGARMLARLVAAPLPRA